MSLLSRSIDTTPDERVRARRANRLDADLVVSLASAGAGEPGIFFFGTERSFSPAGRVVAEAIGHRLGMPVEARATPMLRETRSPAVVVAMDRPVANTGVTVAEVVVDLYLKGVPQENSAR